jgi:Family of unknown function (DUF6496)
MREFKHGELKSGRVAKGGKVKGRRQAIAIALKETGASKYESKRENKRNLAKAERKEARGDTYQQERPRAPTCDLPLPGAASYRTKGLRDPLPDQSATGM